MKDCWMASKRGYYAEVVGEHVEAVGKFQGKERKHCQRCGQWTEAPKTNGELEVCKTLVAGSTPAGASKDLV